ncbi:hypothetical protein H0H81_002086 [Sphagnurus paluster]|uniref:Uncharacterized protein n=1 Tax=Sphagnurus paluster TaxID=117069 RepID=A0A9P7G051_9AGAR|nr:hypothetical protein H0H81_002086 [Sphagnurus paluster]
MPCLVACRAQAISFISLARDTRGNTLVHARRSYFPSVTAHAQAEDPVKAPDPGSGLPVQLDLLERYRALISLGKIQYDEEQVRVVMQLRRLQKDLVEYAPPSVVSGHLRPHTTMNASQKDPTTSWWTYSAEEETDVDSKALVRQLNFSEEIASLDTPKGLLLTGPPGAGKSFLVDTWFAALPTRFKARKHYNQFVLELYRAVWEETQRRMAASTRSAAATTKLHHPERGASWTRSLREHWRGLVQSGAAPIKWPRAPSPGITPDPPMAFTIARRLVLRHWLLVFDEVQLLDVSSAVLLADVLAWYWRLGGVVVGTSNKVPDDLYRNGVQRERLEPFVEALKVRCPVLVMGSKKDWRQEKSGDGQGRTWFVGEEGAIAFDIAIENIKKRGAKSGLTTLNVFGRTLSVPWSSGDACMFKFSELCNETLGPADYITLASNFRIIIITDIPVLKLSEKDQARRFIAFIDAVYESRCRLVCRADSDPEHMFFPEALLPEHQSSTSEDMIMAESVMETQEKYRPNVSSYNAPEMAEAPVSPGQHPLTTVLGQDEQFAFKRALSRLVEMTSASYGKNDLDTWTPLHPSARKWETKATGNPQAIAFPPRVMGQDDIPGESDFAEEAAYPSDVMNLKRPSAPRLSADHVWGVREDWGPGAGAWGRSNSRHHRERSPK